MKALANLAREPSRNSSLQTGDFSPRTCSCGWISIEVCSASCCWRTFGPSWPPLGAGRRADPGPGRSWAGWWGRRGPRAWCRAASRPTAARPARWCTRSTSRSWPFWSGSREGREGKREESVSSKMRSSWPIVPNSGKKNQKHKWLKPWRRDERKESRRDERRQRTLCGENVRVRKSDYSLKVIRLLL